MREAGNDSACRSRYGGLRGTINVEPAARSPAARANAELVRFNRSAVGRELRTMELNREVNGLLNKAWQPPAYDLSLVQEEQQTRAQR